MKRVKIIGLLLSCILIYVAINLFLYPYLEKLQKDTFLPYLFNSKIVISVIMKFLIAQLIVLIMKEAKLLNLSNYKNSLFVTGLTIYVLYFILAGIYFIGCRDYPITNILNGLTNTYSELMWLPSFFIAFKK